MVDIHCHILYGVDDGSDDLAETVEMLRLAERGGTVKVIATPHSNVPGSYRNYWCAELESRLALINSELKREGVGIEVYPGQEIFTTPETAGLLREGKLITLNGSRYALVEFDFYEYSVEAYAMLGQIKAEGYVPIVAHPERYAFVCEEDDAAMRLKDLGCLLQVNKGSLKGSFGMRAKREAYRLLDDGLADFVASDAHSPYVRTPFLADAHEAISVMYSRDYADMLFKTNPSLVLENKEIFGF